MTKSKPQKENCVSLPGLGIQISKEFETQILKEVLEYKEKPLSLSPTGIEFRDGLKNLVKHPRYPHILRTPNWQLLIILRNSWMQDGPIFDLIIRTWKNANIKLVEDCSAWINEKQDLPDPFASQELEDGQSKDGIISSLASQFGNGNTDLKLEAVKLAMAVAMFEKHLSTGRAALSGEEQNQTIETIGTELPQESKVQPMPIATSEWIPDLLSIIDKAFPPALTSKDVDELIENIRLLAEKKWQQQRAIETRGRLADHLDDISSLIQENSEYFKFSQRMSWNFDEIDPTKYPELERLLDNIQKDFIEFAELQQQKPETKEKRRKQNEYLDNCEERIQNNYAGLNALLGHGEKSKEIIVESPENSPELDDIPIKKMQAVLQEPMADDNAVDEQENAIVSENEQEAPPGSDLQVEPKEDETITHTSSETHLDQTDNRSEGVESPATANNTTESMRAGDENLAQVETSLQRIILQGDYSRAHWIALSLEKHHRQAVSSQILAGLQGVTWLLQSWPLLSSALKDDIRETVRPEEISPKDEEEALLGLGIAIVMVLFERGLGWENWLANAKIPPGKPNLEALVRRLDDLSHTSLTLEPSIVVTLIGKEELEHHINDLAQKAKNWLEYAPSKRSRFEAANKTWERIVKKENGFATWLSIAAQNNQKLVDKLLDDLGIWNESHSLEKHIQHTFQQLVGKSKTIEGEARDQMIRWLKEAAEIAEEWAGAVKNTRAAEEKKWNYEQTRILVEFLKGNLKDTIQELSISSDENKLLMIPCLKKTLENLAPCFEKNLTKAAPKETVPWQRYDREQSLKGNLVQVLYYYPQLTLDKEGVWQQPENIDELLELYNPPMTRDQAYMGWLNDHDYRFLHFLEAHERKTDHLLSRKTECLENDLLEMEKALDKTHLAIQQAWFEGLIPIERYDSNQNQIAAWRQEYNRIRENPNGSLDLPDFNAFFEKMRLIREDLESAHQHRNEKQRKEWESLNKNLSGFISDMKLRNDLQPIMDRLFDRKDLRAIDELLNILSDIRAGKKGQDAILVYLNQEQRENKLAKFNQTFGEMVKRFNDSRSLSPLVIGRELSDYLPRERQKEVSDAIQAWLELKQHGQNRQSENFSHISTIIRYLGWDISSPNDVSRINDVPAGFQHWRVQANPRVAISVPQLGSEREGIYDLIGAWDKPASDLIEALSRKIGEHRAFILLYFGRMVPNQRASFLQLCRRKQLPIVMVDELLMLFLAQEYQVRLPAFLECSLPYAYINPYVPFATANVPPEMFFGREEEKRKLKDPYGPSIVYGGRQLGKSALLRQVQREFHRPQDRQYAIYEDIRLVGYPPSGHDYEQELAERLIPVLTREKLLPSASRNITLRLLCERLIDIIKKDNIRLLMLLDEADNLLHTDSKKQFPVVSQLKRVMDQTDRKFKVVFAGLHHVQQFKNIRNQPLAHLGSSDAIQIGPMEQGAAIDLLKIPLQSLGYVFGKHNQEDLSLPLLVFSYTNYHPSLLQLFGQHLVDSLREKPASRANPIDAIPYPITREDIEAVYRNRKVRDTILERFNITLALDERYEAIALTLILEQLAERNGFNRLFSPAKLLQSCKVVWPQGFDNTSVEQFAVLLEEMCGLGVLSNTGSASGMQYRLRSPNLVYLLGTEKEIEERILEISKKENLSEEKIFESYHSSGEGKASFEFSPLTYSQEKLIQGENPGVSIAFGSQATRIYNLSSSVRQMIERQDGKGLFREIGISAHNGLALRQQLQSIAKEYQPERFILVYRELTGTSPEMIEQVAEAIKFCRQTRNRIRVVFELNEYNAWDWHMTPMATCEQIEHNVQTLSLERWNKAGIRQIFAMSRSELHLTDTHIDTIYSMSHGWPILLEPLGHLCQSENSIETIISKYRQELETHHDTFKSLGKIDPRLNRFVANAEEVIQQLGSEARTIDDILEFVDGGRSEINNQMVAYLTRMQVLHSTAPFLDSIVVREFHNEREK